MMAVLSLTQVALLAHTIAFPVPDIAGAQKKAACDGVGVFTGIDAVMNADPEYLTCIVPQTTTMETVMDALFERAVALKAERQSADGGAFTFCIGGTQVDMVLAPLIALQAEFPDKNLNELMDQAPVAVVETPDAEGCIAS